VASDAVPAAIPVVKIQRLENRTPESPIKKRVGIDTKNSIAMKSAPDCSDAPFHTMIGIP